MNNRETDLVVDLTIKLLLRWIARSQRFVTILGKELISNEREGCIRGLGRIKSRQNKLDVASVLEIREKWEVSLPLTLS
jgi:hypothetical protein